MRQMTYPVSVQGRKRDLTLLWTQTSARGETFKHSAIPLIKEKALSSQRLSERKKNLNLGNRDTGVEVIYIPVYLFW
jgi:hypothetical protein